MNRFGLVFVAGLVACLSGVSARAEIVDGVAATIGTEVVLRSDVEIEMASMMQQSGGLSAEDYSKLFRQTLEQAIERELLYREAQLSGMQVPDKAIEERMDKFVKQYESRDAFMKMVEEAGQTMAEFRERLRKELMAITMSLNKHRELEKDAAITESEVAQYYEDHKEEFSRPERVQVRRIFLEAAQDSAERATVKARLEALHEELVLGADFGELAKKYSKGPEAANGGLVGWVAKGDLVQALDKAVFALEAGHLSEAVETEYGFTLLKVEAKEAAGMAAFDEARSDIEPKLRAAYAEAQFKKWMDELRKRGQVRLLLSE